MNNIKTQIAKLTTSQFGGFGEYVIKQFYSEKYDIKTMHKEQTDYIIDGVNKDVKSRRFLNEKYNNRTQKFRGKKFEGVEYITLNFYKDYIILSDVETYHVFDWNTIDKLYNDYKILKSIKTKKKSNKDDYSAIKKYIRSINTYIKVRIVIRDEITDSLWSDRNQAHNLYPNENQMKKYDCTCYLSINRARDVVKYIFLIPHNQKIVDSFLTVEPYKYVKNKGTKLIFDIRKMKGNKKYDKYFFESESAFVNALMHLKW